MNVPLTLSWQLSFILQAVPARVALGVTTLLTMSTQTASINSALPPVAYTKAIDVWQGVCVGFVFSALMEYALVNYALRGKGKRKRKLSEAAAEIENQVRMMDETVLLCNGNGQNGKSKNSPKSNINSDHIVLYNGTVGNGMRGGSRKNSDHEQQFNLNNGGNILMVRYGRYVSSLLVPGMVITISSDTGRRVRLDKK